MNIDELFEWFLNVWDEDWSRKLTNNIEGKKKEWAESLAGKSREELLQAFRKAKTTYDKPPSIKQFTELCSKSQVSGGWSHIKATEIAEAKIQKVYSNALERKDFQMIETLRYVFRDLEFKIFNAQNDNPDFAICHIAGCYHYEIFDKNNLDKWLCKKHDGSYDK